MPNQNIKRLFGKWRWLESSGGIGGVTINPVTESYSLTIEFTEKGIFKSFKNGKETDKCKFELSEGPSIMGIQTDAIINYIDRSGFLGLHHDSWKQSAGFNGNDTLILYDEMYDGFIHSYIRQN